MLIGTVDRSFLDDSIVRVSSMKASTQKKQELMLILSALSEELKLAYNLYRSNHNNTGTLSGLIKVLIESGYCYSSNNGNHTGTNAYNRYKNPDGKSIVLIPLSKFPLIEKLLCEHFSFKRVDVNVESHSKWKLAEAFVHSDSVNARSIVADYIGSEDFLRSDFKYEALEKQIDFIDTFVEFINESIGLYTSSITYEKFEQAYNSLCENGSLYKKVKEVSLRAVNSISNSQRESDIRDFGVFLLAKKRLEVLYKLSHHKSKKIRSFVQHGLKVFESDLYIQNIIKLDILSINYDAGLEELREIVLSIKSKLST